MKKACRRPLYADIVLQTSRWKNRHQPPRKPSKTNDIPHKSASGVSFKPLNDSKEEKSWQQLLAEAAELANYLTEEEHNTVFRLASIMLLGYLLPYSTGNDYYLLEDFRRDHADPAPLDIEKETIQLPLETRIRKSIRNLPVNEVGDILTDPYHDVAFHDFMTRGLVPLLEARPFPREQVDLLHIFAMIIHPCPTALFLPRYYKRDCSIWRNACQIVECSYGCHFQIQYRHRVQSIQILAKSLTIPPLPVNSIRPVTALLRGAIPHLQAALHCFAIGAESIYDAYLAYRVKVNLDIQTQNVEIIRDGWDSLLHHFDENSDHGCGTCLNKLHHRKCIRNAFDIPNDEDTFCLNSARGQLLSFFILRSCGTYDIVDPELLYKMVEGLGERIEWQLENWKRCDKPNNGNDAKRTRSPCLLAALLSAARYAFLFRPSRLKDEDDDPCATPIECAIQLLSHPNASIAEESAKLLTTAFRQDRDNNIRLYAVSLFQGIYEMLKGDGGIAQLTELAGVATEQTPQHGLSLMNFLFEIPEIESDGQLHRRLQVIVAIAMNCPLIAFKQVEKLVLLMNSIPLNSTPLLFPAITASRLAHFLPGKDDKNIHEPATRILSLDAWSRYKVAQHSIVSGNFLEASQCFSSLLDNCSNENHYLWIDSLEQLSSAEAALAARASMGIPDAVEKLQRAVDRLHRIRNTKESYHFTIAFLRLRLDFLDLTTVLRQLTREMRLTGSYPSKKTRNHLYMLNTIKSFKIIAQRFKRLCWEGGIRFRHYQSRMALCIHSQMALFLLSLTQMTFADAKSVKQKLSFLCDNSLRHPMAVLMREMASTISEETDSIARAEILLQLLDGLLMTPVPIPRDIFLPKSDYTAELQLLVSSGDREHNIIHAFPTAGFEFQVVGCISPNLLREALDPIAMFSVWFRVSYVAPIDDEDGNKGDDEAEADTTTIATIPDLSKLSPWSGTFCPTSGRFADEIEGMPFADEGVFLLEAQLGCQDIAGKCWKLQSVPASIRIRVARPR
ncbi:hypothetical protein FisN_1Lh245 [Fistulifera solaris]|uniref:Integrator complex subunit 7 helical bundle domain-containing protein n=1 Tax=Fistulifera solaris TaxID=1519565 RepID=A0A1Z5K4H6_FISSO|nr:hypothetical protein FisN_1Lh245 [Fistulifera solaris]|eukprot:GAX21082.1 hypothetical protein FisN_1Lh245 [Fistulifera solaris]